MRKVSNVKDVSTYIEVRVPLRFEHRWKNAPKHRSYLRSYHPHNFEVRLEMQVFVTDREIEFHDVQDWLYALVFTSVDSFHEDSCENIAAKLLSYVKEKFGANREIQIEVWEDESCGGKIKYVPKAQVES